MVVLAAVVAAVPVVVAVEASAAAVAVVLLVVAAVVSAVEAELEPAGSPLRAGSAFSLTEAVAFSTPTGWSGVWMTTSGSRSSAS